MKPGAPAPTPDEMLLDGFAVLDECHREMLAMLHLMRSLLVQLDAASQPAQVQQLAGQIHQFFSTTSRHHHEDEELHVFPRLEAEASPAMVTAVRQLKQDHHWLEEDWAELAPLLLELANGLPVQAPSRLRQAASVFDDLLRAHIALEEGFVYPAARLHAPDKERGAMAREMAQRRHAHKGRH